MGLRHKRAPRGIGMWKVDWKDDTLWDLIRRQLPEPDRRLEERASTQWWRYPGA